ncbi:WecB/TagA/CpsF family glycosyltransferase [Shewanella subflava]|uniref:WecB/TagA/CpsF family glycosyltransferase n=1 Tax=Shewanella subflava TaxID=2986476 RepID=A0ABT3I4U5_9GAMM|nr:WecB/TagA/CpsF family glycosyltransferase [Shewanella subflava]MCW3171043.1 WecB/TagA/CpsF family glycosyltransferase [Shewanella subflava]
MRIHIKQVSASVRIIETLLSLMILVFISPILLLKAIHLKMTSGKVFETLYIHSTKTEPIPLLQFSDSKFSSLLGLLNVIKGELGLVGEQYQYAVLPYHDYLVRPGLMSFKQMHARMGISYDHYVINPKLNTSAGCYLLATLRCLLGYTLSSRVIYSAQKQFSLFKVTISNMTMNDAISCVINSAKTSQCDSYAFVNADCMNIAYKNQQYRQILNQNKHVFADGSGLRLACKLQRIALKDNVNGTDMFPLLCQQAAEHGVGIFMLGAKTDIANKAAAKMQLRFPQLRICGTHDGYFSAQQTEAVINTINASGAQILLVAMGAPTQERWIAEHSAKLNVGAAIGVGGLFDFYADSVSRAPVAVRQMGMEWTWRLMQEPKRMWRRYVVGNPLFVMRVFTELVQQKIFNSKSEPTANLGELQNAAINFQNANSTAATEQTLSMLGKNLHQVNHKKYQWFFLKIKLNLIAKRLLDIFGSSALLLLLSPLFLLTALAIRFESKGAVLFSQTRAGQDNQPFTMWKFRSMFNDAEARLAKLQSENEMRGGVLFKMKQDPRITQVGKWIRKLSIDELPQLWNVLKGDMSLVGPRPALPSEVNQYQLSDRRRLMVKPGITCIWQVSGRSDIPFDKQVELDVDYIYQQSLVKDIQLLFKTIPAVLFARGAY